MKNKKMVNLIGTLMVLPIYVIILFILNQFIGVYYTILFPITMYIPILIGLIISFISYKKESSKILGLFILIFMGISIYFYYDTYYVTHDVPFGGLASFFRWILNSIILRILTIIFFGKISGIKKTIIFFLLYLVGVGLSLLLGFWE